MTRPRRDLRVALGLALAVAAATVGDAREIRLGLRVQPKLELERTASVYVGPFVLEPGGEGGRRVDAAAVRELDRYVRRLLRRETSLSVLPPEPTLVAPSQDSSQLRGMKDFWRALSQRTGADYVLAAAVDVEVLDRTGYSSEKYVSPADGKTYYRQVLVEETGFRYDILLVVFDADGEPVLEEQISDFQPRQARKLEETKDMYEGLYALEERLLGIFVPRVVHVRRYLYTG